MLGKYEIPQHMQRGKNLQIQVNFMGQSDELFKYVTGKCSLEGKKKKKENHILSKGDMF